MSLLLDECLQAAERGESVLESYLARYPEEAPEIRELCRTYLALQSLPRIQPRPAFRQGAGQRLAARIRADQQLAAKTQPAQRRAAQPAPQTGFWTKVFGRMDVLLQPRAALALALTLVMIFSTGFTVSASRRAVPGDNLYGLKRQIETARLSLAPAASAPTIHLDLARSRQMEIAVLSRRGDFALVPVLETEFSQHVEQAVTLVETQGQPTLVQVDVLEESKALLESHADTLEAVQFDAPADTQPLLSQALTQTNEQLETINQDLILLGAVDPTPTGTLTITATATLTPEASPTGPAITVTPQPTREDIVEPTETDDDHAKPTQTRPADEPTKKPKPTKKPNGPPDDKKPENPPDNKKPDTPPVGNGGGNGHNNDNGTINGSNEDHGSDDKDKDK